ncbi:hypothetical protein MP228_009646 [Amoeboaphelidium protococcarum]|nr:hypothetical protein MP228_009646 [Amoeboaphelidium protococcarum]
MNEQALCEWLAQIFIKVYNAFFTEILGRDLHSALNSTTAPSASDYQRVAMLIETCMFVAGVDQYSQFISKLLASLLMLVEELTAVRYCARFMRLFRLDPQSLRISTEDVGRCVSRAGLLEQLSPTLLMRLAYESHYITSTLNILQTFQQLYCNRQPTNQLAWVEMMVLEKYLHKEDSDSA